MSVETLNYLVALGAVALQIITVALALAYLLRKQYAFFDDVIRPVGKWGMLIGLATVLGAIIVSLYYSNVLGFEPCPLCWWIRIFMYPQAILFAVALWLKDKNVTLYSIAFSVVGFCIALYNHVLQVLPSGTLPCPSSGTVSCAQRILFEFGYVTFPLLGATLFAFLIVVMIIIRRQRN